jgi:O-antigen/teichoic acid export membrane protein
VTIKNNVFSLFKLLQQKINLGDDRSINIKKNVVKMLINKGLSVFVSLLYVPLFLSFLDNTRYGLWVTLLSVINWIGFFDVGLGQGLRNKLTFAIAMKNYDLAKIYVSTTYAIVTIVFLSITFIVLGISPFVDFSKVLNTPDNLVAEINVVVLVVICIMNLSFITRIFDSIAFAIQKPSLTSDIQIISHTLTLVTVYLVNKLFGINSLVVFGFIVTLIPLLVKLIYSIIFFRKKLNYIAPSFKFIKLEHSKELFSIGIIFFIIQIFCIILAQCNTIIISNVVSPDAVPEYYIANKYFGIMMMLFTIVVTPIWSATTDAYALNDFNWIKKTIKKLEKLFLFFVFAGLLMLILSQFIIPIWTHDRVEVRFWVAFLSYFYVIVYMLSNIYITVINGVGKILLQLFVTIAVSIIHVFLAIYFGKQFGTLGVLAVQVVSYSFILIWSYIQYRLIILKKDKGIWSR